MKYTAFITGMYKPKARTVRLEADNSTEAYSMVVALLKPGESISCFWYKWTGSKTHKRIFPELDEG